MKKIKKIGLLALILYSALSEAKEIHVSVDGSDNNSGTIESQFKTISAAAKIASAGDTVTVYEGIYREWVSPLNGGRMNAPILYRSASDEKVHIKGSEPIKGWVLLGKGIWKVEIKNELFGDFNPYQEVVQGDWLATFGRDHHLGEVYLNGKAFYEMDSLHKIQQPQIIDKCMDKEKTIYQWYCESNEKTTTIWANFHEYNPNEELVEINVRKACFFPVSTGVNYITVRGFEISQAATQWAPPTAFQEGMIGPYWSKGWIIENNIIHDSKCSGISLGKERSTGHNDWTTNGIKHGAQREREAVFKALLMGWNQDNIGSHIVRNNQIYNCGQTGICGHMGAIFSEITNNHIHNIANNIQFSGAELGGIKLHAPIDVVIKQNHIHHCEKGMWIDWQAQGIRITQNLMHNNVGTDILIEVCHGPHIIDNNILLSNQNLTNLSQGGAYIHNFFGGLIFVKYKKPFLDRFTPYHFPHSTAILGLMKTHGGDERFYNNIFAGGSEERIDSECTGENSWRIDHLAYGLAGYNSHPSGLEDSTKILGPNDFGEIEYPVYIQNNLYIGENAQPYLYEKGAVTDNEKNLNLKLEERADGYYLHITTYESFEKVETSLIQSDMLGVAIQSEAPYESFNGKDIRFDTDYFGRSRNNEQSLVGPFSSLKQGDNVLKVFEIDVIKIMP